MRGNLGNDRQRMQNIPLDKPFKSKDLDVKVHGAILRHLWQAGLLEKVQGPKMGDRGTGWRATDRARRLLG